MMMLVLVEEMDDYFLLLGGTVKRPSPSDFFFNVIFRFDVVSTLSLERDRE